MLHSAKDHLAASAGQLPAMSIADALSRIQVQNHLRLVYDFAARFSRASLFIWSIYSLAMQGWITG